MRSLVLVGATRKVMPRPGPAGLIQDLLRGFGGQIRDDQPGDPGRRGLMDKGRHTALDQGVRGR